MGKEGSIGLSKSTTGKLRNFITYPEYIKSDEGRILWLIQEVDKYGVVEEG